MLRKHIITMKQLSFYRKEIKMNINRKSILTAAAIAGLIGGASVAHADSQGQADNKPKAEKKEGQKCAKGKCGKDMGKKKVNKDMVKKKKKKDAKCGGPGGCGK